MGEWILIVVLVLSLFFLGCEGLDRLTGGREVPKEEINPKAQVVKVQKTESQVLMEFGGVFTNSNFAEMKDAPMDKELDVIIIRKEKTINVEPYSKKADEENRPYYIKSDTGGLIFFNHQYGDEYQIFVLK